MILCYSIWSYIARNIDASCSQKGRDNSSIPPPKKKKKKLWKEGKTSIEIHSNSNACILNCTEPDFCMRRSHLNNHYICVWSLALYSVEQRPWFKPILGDWFNRLDFHWWKFLSSSYHASYMYCPSILPCILPCIESRGRYGAISQNESVSTVEFV